MNVFAEDDDCFVGEQRQYTVGTQCAEDAFQDYEIDSVCEEDEGFRFLKETNEKIDFLIYCLQDEKVVILRGEKPTLEMILLKLSLMQTARAKQYYLDELCVNFVFHNSDLFAPSKKQLHPPAVFPVSRPSHNQDVLLVFLIFQPN